MTSTDLIVVYTAIELLRARNLDDVLHTVMTNFYEVLELMKVNGHHVSIIMHHL